MHIICSIFDVCWIIIIHENQKLWFCNLFIANQMCHYLKKISNICKISNQIWSESNQIFQIEFRSHFDSTNRQVHFWFKFSVNWIYVFRFQIDVVFFSFSSCENLTIRQMSTFKLHSMYIRFKFIMFYEN